MREDCIQGVRNKNSIKGCNLNWIFSKIPTKITIKNNFFPDTLKIQGSNKSIAFNWILS